MMIAFNFMPPAFFVLLATIPLLFFRGVLKSIWLLLVTSFTFYLVYSLQIGTITSLSFLNTPLQVLRVDPLSKPFGMVFSVVAIAIALYGFKEKSKLQMASFLTYFGSTLGVVFSGDLLTLYIFWELMAITSTFLILGSKTKASAGAAKRYILVHLAGGLILLAGILLTYFDSGSILFNSFDFFTPASMLILIGFLINAAVFPFSSWLPDAYPQSTILGGTALCVFTTKTAVYALLRGFPGWDILIVLGLVTGFYGLIYALMENNFRRVLAYGLVALVGFKVSAIGIGSSLAIAGVIAYSVSGILYTCLIWMGLNVIVLQTGKTKLTQLGGLFKSMPVTAILVGVGFLSLCAFPFTAGFVTKSLILKSAEKAHLFWPWLCLEAISIGSILAVGAKLYYFLFFSKKIITPSKKPPLFMHVGMGILAILTILLGISPKTLFVELPYFSQLDVLSHSSFSDIYIHHFQSVLTKLQVFFFTLVSFLFLSPYIKPVSGILLDVDWFYRKGSSIFYRAIDKGLNAINRKSESLVIQNIIGSQLVPFFQKSPLILGTTLLDSFATFSGLSPQKRKAIRTSFKSKITKTGFTISLTAIFSLLFFIVLFFYSL